MEHQRKGPEVGREQVSYAYQLFMLFLCVYAIVSLAAGVLFPLRPEFRTLLEYVDYFVCGAFLVDFLLNFRRAEDKAKYFFTWGWIDLLSSIPAIEVLRVGRFARIIRIIRVLRAFKAMQYLTKHLASRRASSAFYSILAVAFSIVVICALAVLRFEIDADGSIHTASDALWWAVTTITTVGYGDAYPVTWEGRIVAVVLMIAGVGLFGTLSGAVAGWFVTPSANESSSELAELKASIDELRVAVEKLSRERTLSGG